MIEPDVVVYEMQVCLIFEDRWKNMNNPSFWCLKAKKRKNGLSNNVVSVRTFN